MIGLVATLIAAIKRHTGFAIFAGLLSVVNIYSSVNGETEGIWIFGWVLLVISIFMKTKTAKTETIVINNSPTHPITASHELDVNKEKTERGKFCGNCGKPLQLDNKYCPHCGSKIE